MSIVIPALVAFGFAVCVIIIVWAFVPRGWRTLAANVIASAGMLVPILDHLSMVPWQQVTDKTTAFWIVQSLVFMNVVLRLITNSPVGRR